MTVRTALVFALAAGLCSLPHGARAAPPIRFMVPYAPFSHAGERDGGLTALVDEYNQSRRAQGASTVQLIRRGDSFSSLKDLMALYLAGDPPEIAAIESSELPALSRAKLAVAISPSLSSQLKLAPNALTIPFQRTLPVLVTDRNQLPVDWKELGKFAPTPPGVTFPLQGPRGLWIFEALAGKPLWIHEPGGLRANRELEEPIAAIQRLQEAGPTGERAIEDFLERKTSWLATSLDALPWLAHKATFQWKAALLPAFGSKRSAGPLTGGSELVVTRDRADVWNFLSFLYSKEAGGRWAIASGFLPLQADWKNTAEWKAAPVAYRALAQTDLRRLQARTTDPEVVRAHTEWVSALRHLFGDPSQRLPVEIVFTQLDASLTLK